MVSRSDLQPASLSGVPFLVGQDDLSSGPNTVHHKYPDKYRNPAYIEDNGLNAREFKISATLFNPNVASKARALEAAINSPGVKTLKHPWLGTKVVKASGPGSYHRTQNDAGVITLDITFIETSAGAVFPAALTSIAAMVPSLTGLASQAVLSQLNAKFLPSISVLSLQKVAGNFSGLTSIIGSKFSSIASVNQLTKYVNGNALSMVSSMKGRFSSLSEMAKGFKWK